MPIYLDTHDTTHDTDKVLCLLRHSLKQTVKVDPLEAMAIFILRKFKYWCNSINDYICIYKVATKTSAHQENMSVK